MTLTNEVKFMVRAAGGMLQYETLHDVDMIVVHDSYSALRSTLHRPGKVRDLILHASVSIKDDESRLGIRLHPGKRLLVVYYDFDFSPLSYNGFQG